MHIGEQTEQSLITFGSNDVITRAKKDVFFFVRPSHSLFSSTLPSSVWMRSLGAEISGCELTLIEWTSFCFEFWLETGEFEEKVKKEVFLDGQKQANMAIFVGDPQVSPTISQRDYFFPVRRHVSGCAFLY